VKAKETEIRFETGFQQSKTGLKKPILTSIIASISFYAHLKTHFQLYCNRERSWVVILKGWFRNAHNEWMNTAFCQFVIKLGWWWWLLLLIIIIRAFQRIAGTHATKYFGCPWKFKIHKIVANLGLLIQCASMKHFRDFCQQNHE